ncbi:MAG TPA: Spy/CpxP family protein refolding chaperone [Micropepsaceae bacterium]|nr:Spy/CpxP family protein refolding chaperone [Micropepsaceae bacterium]
MKVFHGLTCSAAAALVIATLGTSAWAATAAPGEPPLGRMMGPNGMGAMITPGMMGGMMGPNGTGAMMMPGMMGGQAIDHIEGRIAFLKAELKITAAQDSIWNNFEAALRANAADIAKLREEAVAANSKAPQNSLARLEFQEHALSTRLTGMHAITASYSGLYGSMSEEQKKAADSLVGSGMGPMGRMMPVAQSAP